MWPELHDRLSRSEFRDAVEAAICERAGESVASDAHDRLSHPGKLDYVGTAIKQDIPRYPQYAESIAEAYLEEID